MQADKEKHAINAQGQKYIQIQMQIQIQIQVQMQSRPRPPEGPANKRLVRVLRNQQVTHLSSILPINNNTER
jgi:hypothetical protein